MKHPIFEIIDSFYKNIYSPIYFLNGSENYFKDKFLQAIEKNFTDDSSRSLNFHKVYAGEQDSKLILPLCKDLAMMAEHRIVFIHQADLLQIADTAKLELFLQQPEKQNIVVFESVNFDKRKKLFSILKNNSTYIESNPIKGEDNYLKFISEHCKLLRLSIENEAAKLLYDHVGDDLFSLQKQLEKLALYKGENSKILSEDIEMMTGISREYSVFELCKAVLKKEKEKAYRILKILLEQGNEAIAINAALFFRFNKQWQYLAMKQNGKNDNEIASTLKVPPFYLNEYKDSIRSFSPVSLKSAISVITEADYRLKSSSGSSIDTMFNCLNRIFYENTIH